MNFIAQIIGPWLPSRLGFFVIFLTVFFAVIGIKTGNGVFLAFAFCALAMGAIDYLFYNINVFGHKKNN